LGGLFDTQACEETQAYDGSGAFILGFEYLERIAQAGRLIRVELNFGGRP
jgi:hypothetical protein